MKTHETAAKPRVTSTEVNRWIKWLQKQGFFGPYVGLTRRHPWVKRLAKELKENPRKARPCWRDPRTIATNLDRHERESSSKTCEGQESGDGTQGDNRYHDAVLATRLDDHWTDLAKLAEELMLGLNFPSRHVVKMEPSRFGGKTSASWFYDPSEVSFSAQMNPLWQYLEVHLDCRYTSPKFSKELSGIQVALARLLQDDRDGDVIENLREARNLTQSLRNMLWLVVQRCTFDDGVCDICENWFGSGSD